MRFIQNVYYTLMEVNLRNKLRKNIMRYLIVDVRRALVGRKEI